MDGYRRRVLLIVVILTAGGFAGLAPGVAAHSCPSGNPESFTKANGHWWILETGDGEHPGTVIEYDEDWNEVSRRGIGSKIDESDFTDGNDSYPSFRGIESTDSGWWTVSGSGVVYRFDDNWTFTGEAHSLGLDDYGVVDLERSKGRWWILTTDEVYAFDEDWDRILVSDYSKKRDYSKRSYARGMYAGEDGLWLVDFEGTHGSMTANGRVHRYTAGASGNGSKISYVRSDYFGWETNHILDVHTDGNGWVVLSDDGTVTEYTSYWQHTGQQRDALPGVGYCEVTIGPATFLLPVIGLAGIFLVPVAMLGSGSLRLFGISAVGSAILAYSFTAFALPWPLSLLYWLPDPLIGCLLLGTIVWQAVSLSELPGSRFARLFALSLVDAPVIYTALMFFLTA